MLKCKIHTTTKNAFPAIISYTLYSNGISLCVLIIIRHQTLIRNFVVYPSDAYKFHYVWNRVTSIKFFKIFFSPYAIATEFFKCICNRTVNFPHRTSDSEIQ